MNHIENTRSKIVPKHSSNVPSQLPDSITYYVVYLNYPTNRRDTPVAIIVDYRNDKIKTFHNEDDAVNYCERQCSRMKPEETYYIVKRQETHEHSIYYMTSKNNGMYIAHSPVVNAR